jgi:hypothetical protein
MDHYEYVQTIRAAVSIASYLEVAMDMVDRPSWMPEGETLSEFTINTTPGLVRAHRLLIYRMESSTRDWPIAAFAVAVLNAFTDEKDVLLFREHAQWRCRFTEKLWEQFEKGDL